MLPDVNPAGLPAGAKATGVSSDSRTVEPGEIFFALPGTTTHGIAFAAAAVARGAAAIVTDQRPSADPGVQVILVHDARAAFARAASIVFAPQPSIAVAVTGTSGKSSVVAFVRQIWQACGIKGASLGTLGLAIGDTITPGELTTPDAKSLHKRLGELKAQGVDHVAIEASSHGLDQRRLDGVTFRAAAFTNLSHDHLDYHANLDAYREAKLRLFTDLLTPRGAAIVNVDDPEHGPFLYAALSSGAHLMTVGREGGFIQIGQLERRGLAQHVTIRLKGKEMDFTLPLAGEFQVSNALIAASLAIASGIAPDRAIAALSGLKGAKGRMELVGQKNTAGIYVDYAHKPAALQSVLEALRPFVVGRLILVFGCGGDRDREKRSIMGKIAAHLADLVIVTDDNPRTENPASIRAAILAAAPGAREIGDRAEAIRAGIAELKPGDVLLVAGKGHEDYQIVGTERRHFSDHEVVAGALRK
ncbi:MAG: UDP-N-acetylmuramoyl-L-alanyl-D-glutamate--2,6-diaminopimelate ligase [Cucumibacter sp.]